MKHDPVDISRALAQVTPGVVKRYYSIPGTCIVATRVNVEVARMFGIQAYGLAVTVLAMNEPMGHYLMKTGKGWDALTRTEVAYLDERGAHCVLLGPQPESPWSGHVVTIMGTSLLDTAIAQVNRPEWGITAHSFAMHGIDRDFLRGRGNGFARFHTGTTVAYRAYPTDKAWKNAPLWKVEDRWKPLVAETFALMSAELGGIPRHSPAYPWIEKLARGEW